jgi:hypothetical protein
LGVPLLADHIRALTESFESKLADAGKPLVRQLVRYLNWPRDETVIIATPRQPSLLLSYLQTYVSDLQWWLAEWRIAINVSKSSAIFFARAGRRYIQPRPVIHFGEPIKWVDTIRYLGVTLDKRLTWSRHIKQVRKWTAQRMGLLGPLLNRKSDLSVRNGVPLYKQLVRPLMDYACPACRSAVRAHVG